MAASEALLVSAPLGNLFCRHSHNSVNLGLVGRLPAGDVIERPLLPLLLLLRELVRLLEKTSRMTGSRRAEYLRTHRSVSGVELGRPRELLGREACEQLGPLASLLGSARCGRLFKCRLVAADFLQLALRPLLPFDLFLELPARVRLQLLLLKRLLHLRVRRQLSPPCRLRKVICVRRVAAHAADRGHRQSSTADRSAIGCGITRGCTPITIRACSYPTPRLLHRRMRSDVRFPLPWAALGWLLPSGTFGRDLRCLSAASFPMIAFISGATVITTCITTAVGRVADLVVANVEAGWAARRHLILRGLT